MAGRLRRIKRIGGLIEREFRTGRTVDLPASERLWFWRNGFLSEAGAIFDLSPATVDRYLSNYARDVETIEINGPSGRVLDDKLLFHELLTPEFDRYLPDLYYYLPPEGWYPVDAAGEPRAFLRTLADDGRSVVVKPRTGGGGDGVRVLPAIDVLSNGSAAGNGVPDGRTAGDGVPDGSTAIDNPADASPVGDGVPDGDLAVDDERTSSENGRIRAEDGGGDGSGDAEYLLCEYVEQAAYAEAIFPDSTNTIRMLTMFDPRTGEPFLARAVHRFGSSESAPLDNWTEGGCVGKIDEAEGRLVEGGCRTEGGGLRRVDRHPETGEPIAGRAIPRWDAIVEAVLDVAGAYPGLPYVGWDVVATDDEPYVAIVEGNRYSDVNMLQAFDPLLDDPQVRRFYEYHGVI